MYYTETIEIEGDFLEISYKVEVEYWTDYTVTGDSGVINGLQEVESIEDVNILKVEKIFTDLVTLKQTSLGEITPSQLLQNKILEMI